MEESICGICREELSSKNFALECGHVFDLACIEIWLKKQMTCPYCFQKVKTSKRCELFLLSEGRVGTFGKDFVISQLSDIFRYKLLHKMMILLIACF